MVARALFYSCFCWGLSIWNDFCCVHEVSRPCLGEETWRGCLSQGARGINKHRNGGSTLFTREKSGEMLVGTVLEHMTE